jgi:dephospho-CoA kinase
VLNHNLISLNSNACGGKDTLAEKIVTRLGYQNIKFSQPVKDIVSAFLKRPINMGEDRPMIIDVSFYLKNQRTSLEMYSKYGYDLLHFIQDWVRELPQCEYDPFTEKFWANYTLNEHNIGPGCGQKYVFTDIRLPSEYEATKALGAVYIFLDCPQEVREDRMMKRDGKIPEGIWDNSFEKYMLDWDYDIHLDASVYDPELVYREFLLKMGLLKGGPKDEKTH